MTTVLCRMEQYFRRQLFARVSCERLRFTMKSKAFSAWQNYPRTTGWTLERTGFRGRLTLEGSRDGLR